MYLLKLNQNIYLTVLVHGDFCYFTVLYMFATLT